jgi:FtsZ-interacting cell division protein ZipA
MSPKLQPWREWGPDPVESLRWILLAAGAVFILIIYILGRSRRQRNHSIVDELEDDLPEFSANSLDNVDEGVGRVKVITGGNERAMDFEAESHDTAAPDDNTATAYASSGDVNAEPADEHAADQGETDSKKSAATNPSDIVVLYILPKPNEKLRGSQINSAAQAMGLSFGDMNIYHYRRRERNVFSMANMLEPGSFDPDTMHDLSTSGLTVFMQLHEENPMDDLTEMLQRSYQLAGLLDARLCNSKRQPLTEQDAENYREKVRQFIESKNFALTMEAD